MFSRIGKDIEIRMQYITLSGMKTQMIQGFSSILTKCSPIDNAAIEIERIERTGYEFIQIFGNIWEETSAPVTKKMSRALFVQADP